MKGDITQLVSSVARALLRHRWYEGPFDERAARLLSTRLQADAAFTVNTVTGRLAPAVEPDEGLLDELFELDASTRLHVARGGTVVATRSSAPHFLVFERDERPFDEGERDALREVGELLHESADHGPTAELRRVVAELQHHVNNALTAAMGDIAWVHRDEVTDAERDELLTTAIDELGRIPRLLRALNECACTPGTAAGRATLGEVEQILTHDLPARLRDSAAVEYTGEAVPATRVPLAAAALARILEHLIDAASADERDVRILLARAHVDVRRPGRGLDGTASFEPFTTSGDPRRTGLGLSAARALARSAGADVRCVEAGPEDAAFRVEFP